MEGPTEGWADAEGAPEGGAGQGKLWRDDRWAGDDLGEDGERRMSQQEEGARPEGAGPVRLGKCLNTSAWMGEWLVWNRVYSECRASPLF